MVFEKKEGHNYLYSNFICERQRKRDKRELGSIGKVLMKGIDFILPCPKMQFSFSTHIKNIVIHKTGITIFFEFYNIAICENYFCSDNNIMSYGFSGLVSRTIYPLPCTLGSGLSFGMIVI